MAYTIDKEDEQAPAQNDRFSNFMQNVSGPSPVGYSPSPGVQQAAGLYDKQPAPPTQNDPYFGNSGKFISFDRILGANSGNVKKAGQQLNDSLNTQGQNAFNSIGDAYGAAEGAVDAGTYTGNKSKKLNTDTGATNLYGGNNNYFQQQNDQKAGAAAQQDLVNRAQAGYEGPTNTNSYFNNAQQNVTNANKALNATSSTDLLASQLQNNAGGGYSRAQGTLDSNLLTSAYGNQFADTRNKFAGMDQYLGNQRAGAQAYADQGQADTMAQARAAQAALAAQQHAPVAAPPPQEPLNFGRKIYDRAQQAETEAKKAPAKKKTPAPRIVR